MSILEGELAETIGDALLDADIPLDVVLTRTTEDGGDDWDIGTITTTEYACKGFADTFAETYLDGSLIEANDVKVVIVTTTLDTEPSPGDQVTIRGETYVVISVRTDPAQALWALQVRA